MSNHPNRGPKGPASNPAPADIRAVREAAGLSQTAAGALVHTTCRTWQQWESGDRRMHPAFWELFRIKSAL
jgi:DNA-binding transcriptional regulator YiaG